MTEVKKTARPAGAVARSRVKPEAPDPGWSDGLRQIYDQVVDEDLPEALKDLLARLDKPN